MSPADDPRFERQVRLPEVGRVGQEKICGADVRVTEHEGRSVEEEYLERAGVGRTSLEPGREPEPFPHAAWFEFDASRAVGRGAWSALAALRTVLGTGAS